MGIIKKMTGIPGSFPGIPSLNIGSCTGRTTKIP
jgi:hypothetical protein